MNYQAWEECRKSLELELNQDEFSTWISPLAYSEEQKQPYRNQLKEATRYPALSNPESHEIYRQMDEKMANLLPPGQVKAEKQIRQDPKQLNPNALLQNQFYTPAEEKKTDNKELDNGRV